MVDVSLNVVRGIAHHLNRVFKPNIQVNTLVEFTNIWSFVGVTVRVSSKDRHIEDYRETARIM